MKLKLLPIGCIDSAELCRVGVLAHRLADGQETRGGRVHPPYKTRTWRVSKLTCILLLMMMLSGGPSQAADPTTRPAGEPALVPASKELLAEVQKRLRTVTKLEADFDEQKNLAVLKHTLKISGNFALQSPDRVIWKVSKPEPYAISVQGEVVTQWDRATNKVQTINLHGDPTFKAISEQLQAWFLGNYQALEQSYDAFVIAENPLTLRFAPKAGTMVAKLIKYIQITFSGDGITIDKMLIREASGDTTTLNIKNTRINQPIKDATWEIRSK